jgi:DNA adenine methylase
MAEGVGRHPGRAGEAVKPPLAYYGSKVTMGPQIAALLPPHKHYVEPFAGSLAVLLAKRPSQMETINDLNRELMTFWRVLRERPADLERTCALTPHSRAEHDMAFEQVADGDELEIARRVWIRLTQGRSNALQRRTGWRHFVDPGHGFSMPDYLRAYQERMAAAAERLARVSLECLPALDLIAKYGAEPSVALYVDPPYVMSTRNSTHYRHEMTVDEHGQLAEALNGSAAAVVLSGYRSPLYEGLYEGWHSHEIAATNTQGGERSARIEVLWSNRPLATADYLFGEAAGE